MARHHDPNRPVTDEQIADLLAIPGDTRPTLWRTPPAAQPGNLSPQLSRLLLDGHTEVGDVVIDVDDDIAFAATAAATGRRHHALGGERHLASLGHAAGYIDLILLHWPRPSVNPHWLLLACRSLLRTAGCLVIAVSVDAPQRVAHLNALGAANTAGLPATRHVAVLAPTDSTDNRRPGSTEATPAADHAEPPTLDQHTLDPHTDLLIFEPAAVSR
jgi:hypothetical protein